MGDFKQLKVPLTHSSSSHWRKKFTIHKEENGIF